MSNRVIATYYIFVLLLFFLQLANAAVGEPPRLFSPFFGYVEDMNGRAIAGAKIDIAWCESQNDPDRDFSVPPGDNILGIAKSDADGAFHVEWSDDIPIQFEKQEFRLYLCVFHDEFVPFQKPLSLDDSGPILMLIDLKEGMRYADRVVDKTGAPVQGAVVRFEGIYRSAKDTIFASYTEGSQLFLDMSNTPTTRTDENGVFEFYSVPADALILLRVQHPQYSTAMRLRSTFKTLPLVPDLSNKASGFELWWKDFDTFHTARCNSHPMHHISEMLEANIGMAEDLLSIRSLLSAGIELSKNRDAVPPVDYANKNWDHQNNFHTWIATHIQDKCEATSRLARHLRDYEIEFTKHLHDRQIPPTNNYAEQTLRTAVLLRKVGCCNRSEKEIKSFETLTSLFATFVKRGKDFKDWIKERLIGPGPKFVPPILLPDDFSTKILLN